jgi:outer membrane lipoprotein-sorting protein
MQTRHVQHPAVVGALSAAGERTAQTQSATLRVWLQPPRRVRQERVGAAPSHELAIRNGMHWWQREADGSVSSNEHEPDLQTSIAPQALSLFEPAALISTLTLEPLGEDEVAGRRALLARGTPVRLPRARPLLRHYDAHEIELAVDRERGVLLRHVANAAGHTYSILEVDEIAFDAPLPPETFQLPICPPPTEVGARVEELTVASVADRAGFTVWAPGELSEWHVDAYYVPGPPESVHFRVWRSDGRWIWIEQSSTTDAHVNALDGTWKPVHRHDQTFEVLEPRNNIGNQISVRMIRGTTRTNFLTRSVGLETVLDLAASLGPLD